MKTWFLVSAALAFAAGCGGSPCDDYCTTFVEKTSSCGLGGPTGQSAIDSCSSQVDATLTHDACSQANTKIQAMDCASFKQLVCSTPNASTVYNCN